MDGRALRNAGYSPDGKYIVTTYDESGANPGVGKVWNAATGVLVHTLMQDSSNIFYARFTRDSKRIYTVSFEEEHAALWDIETGKRLEQHAGYGQWIAADAYSPAGKQYVKGYGDGSIIIYEDSTGKPLLRDYVLDGKETVTLDPASGLFDATETAMEKMYWMKGVETIEFSQLKDRYWQPGLWKKIMKGETLRDVKQMESIKLQPEVKLGEVKNNILPILLEKREGGYGKVSVFVNNKEVILDARPRGFDTSKNIQQINFDLSKVLLPGKENTIRVKTWNAEGVISSRGVIVKHTASGEVKTAAPSMYAVICGTSSFSNPVINLKYAVPDAEAIAKAVQVGAENLFGKDRTHVFLLTSPGKIPTTKENIKKVFNEIKGKAKPEDILLVYLSGHGITWGGQAGDFYYLTNEAVAASSESFNDPEIRKTQTISTAELTAYINDIPALKQVMMIDACGSGKAVENLVAKRDVEASQIKSIDRMKDRTGMFIISGCAADAVSYEASRFGQGLLTYSLLQAIKGAALQQHAVDVATLFNYAREEVPKMAQGIGGIQQPQLLIPKGGSFDIGIINEADKQNIPLASLKPVYVRTTLFEETKRRDVLKLSALVNEKLSDMAARGFNSKLVFIDTDDYPDACSISGGYTVQGEKISLTGTILCGKQEKEIKLLSLSKDELIDQLVKKVSE